MKNNGFIFIARCHHFLNKLNYFQVCTLLDLTRKKKQDMDNKLYKGVKGHGKK